MKLLKENASGICYVLYSLYFFPTHRGFELKDIHKV